MNWAPDTLRVTEGLVGMPVHLGPLSGPGLLGLGFGGGSTICNHPVGGGSMSSNATFVFLAP